MLSLQRIFRAPWLCVPAPLAHDLSQIYLRLRGLIAWPRTFSWLSFSWGAVEFHNRLGIAGGVDKNADHLKAWWSYGVGFVEVGTVTPQAQASNPKPILARDSSKLALWNKMGFPNLGAEYVRASLSRLGRPYNAPIFVNIGKNRETPNERAHEDYLSCIRTIGNLADAFVINISSPNTKALRELLQPTALEKFLSPLRAATKVPLLLKLSPDLSDNDFCFAIDAAFGEGLNGLVISNTTTAREATPKFSSEGGVSGAPLRARSEYLLKLAIDHLGPRRKNQLVVSVGGVLTPQDVFIRLKLGADLVQVYSALIFSGPRFFAEVADAAIDKNTAKGTVEAPTRRGQVGAKQ